MRDVKLLKKSLSAQSAVQKRPEPRPKHYENGVFSPEQGTEKSAKEFFNTLTCSAKVARKDSKTIHLGDAPLLAVLLH